MGMFGVRFRGYLIRLAFFFAYVFLFRLFNYPFSMDPPYSYKELVIFAIPITVMILNLCVFPNKYKILSTGNEADDQPPAVCQNTFLMQEKNKELVSILILALLLFGIPYTISTGFFLIQLFSTFHSG